MLWRSSAAFLVLVALASASEPADRPSRIEVSSYEGALEHAREIDSRVYLLFKGVSCVWCERQAQEMTKPESMDATEGLVVCVVDVSERKDLARKYGVTTIPAHRLLESDGSAVRGAAGYMKSEGLKEFLGR